MNDTKELKQLVEELIATKREDDWWDFKQCYNDNNVALLHDIICLANNRVDRDAYLIFGVEDKTWNIIGVENDPKRKNQQKVVQLLKSCKFAGDTRPRVEVRTITIDSHELDVFIIKNSSDVPYYLTSDYCDKNNKGYGVRAYHIYTRVLDNNTDINKSADINHVEYLWKKRFGLITTPLEQLKVLLKNPDDWVEEESRYYHQLFPQFTIVVEDEDEDRGRCRMFYHHVQTDNSFSYGIIKLFHYTTQLFSCQSTVLDGGRMTAPCPDSIFISNWHNHNDIIGIYYFATDSIKYLLLRFLERKIGKCNGREAQFATSKLLSVVLLFDSDNSAESFKNYIIDNISNFKETAKNQTPYPISDETELAASVIAKEIQECEALVEMQKTWIDEN